jgi:hypothetical protein
MKADYWIKAVEVNSEMPTREILPELVCPHGADRATQLDHRNEIRVALIHVWRPANACPVDEMMLQVNVILVKLSASREASIHRGANNASEEHAAIYHGEFWPEKRQHSHAGRNPRLSHGALLATNDQLTEGGPSVTPELPERVAGPPSGAAYGSTILCSAILSLKSRSKVATPEDPASEAAGIQWKDDGP